VWQGGIGIKPDVGIRDLNGFRVTKKVTEDAKGRDLQHSKRKKKKEYGASGSCLHDRGFAGGVAPTTPDKKTPDRADLSSA